jgi:hypothetical protein
LHIFDLAPGQLFVNVGKKLTSSLGNDMRAQIEAGAIWISAQLLEIVPYQMVKGKLSPDRTEQMLKFAVRHPATNASLVKSEGLRAMHLTPDNILVRESLSCLFMLLTFN